MRRRPADRLVRLAGTTAGVAALLLTAACAAGRPARTTAQASAAPAATESAGPGCAAFALELPAGVAGQPSPVDAARWFAGHGGVEDVPPDGWHDVGRDETGALVRSGNLTLHAMQGADLTWLVDSGKRC